ncbi:MAG: BamA/TamA family outer membrane protein, partial [Longimicrobiales bacterium]
FGRSALTLRTGFPLFARLRASLEGAAGSSVGDVPIQRLYYLGGPATLRGYDGSSAVGNSFWRARAEIARGIPAARIALFGDVAWAGDRETLTTDGALRSVGLGVTLLDGLVRADLARALDGAEDWRFDLWVSW